MYNKEKTAIVLLKSCFISIMAILFTGIMVIGIAKGLPSIDSEKIKVVDSNEIHDLKMTQVLENYDKVFVKNADEELLKTRNILGKTYQKLDDGNIAATVNYAINLKDAYTNEYEALDMNKINCFEIAASTKLDSDDIIQKELTNVADINLGYTFCNVNFDLIYKNKNIAKIKIRQEKWLVDGGVKLFPYVGVWETRSEIVVAPQKARSDKYSLEEMVFGNEYSDNIVLSSTEEYTNIANKIVTETIDFSFELQHSESANGTIDATGAPELVAGTSNTYKFKYGKSRTYSYTDGTVGGGKTTLSKPNDNDNVYSVRPNSTTALIAQNFKVGRTVALQGKEEIGFMTSSLHYIRMDGKVFAPNFSNSATTNNFTFGLMHNWNIYNDFAAYYVFNTYGEYQNLDSTSSLPKDDYYDNSFGT